MKICKTCKETKTLEDFGLYKKSSDGRYHLCRLCKRKYDNAYYRTKDGRRRDTYERNKGYREAVKKYVRDYLLTHPCVDCGNSNPIVLEFDHIRDKTANVSRLVAHSNSIARVQLEIDKCEVRCANCHRIKTAERAGWNMSQ